MNRRQLLQALEFVVAARVPPSGGKSQRPGWEAAQQAIRSWSRHPSIQGFGIAQRMVGIGCLTLKVYVDRRCRFGASGAASIPRRILVPGIRMPVPVEVEAMGRIRLQGGRDDRPTYDIPELTIIRSHGTPGTAGCIVAKRGTTDRFLLSCAHVMAWNIKEPASPGNQIVGPAVDREANPDPGASVIATLEAWSPREEDADGAFLDCDAAVARLGANVSPALLQQIGTPANFSPAVGEGNLVWHRGARSGRHEGKVRCAHFAFTGHYEGLQGSQRSFTLSDLVLCEATSPADQPFSVGGDSGSAVYRSSRDGSPILVGLIVGGASGGSVFCRIGKVFDRFGLDIVKNVDGAHSASQPSPVAPPPAPPPLAESSPPTGLAIDKVSVELVLDVFGDKSIRPNVELYLPKVLAALKERNLTDAIMVAMALATIRAESAGFAPISEGQSAGNSTVLDLEHAFDKYDKKNGNLGRPDGRTYRGRGFVQLTGRGNYARYGDLIKIDLVTEPNAANEPVNAARLLACFLTDKEPTIRAALRKSDLATARKAVNGGLNGFKDFSDAYQRCIDLL
jgi:predicted chitinase